MNKPNGENLLIEEKKELSGSMTVFFTFIFLILIAFAGTIIELARMDVAKSYTAQVTHRATYSLFTEYCEPLYKRYSLFYIEDAGEPFEQTIARYMNETFKGSGQKTLRWLNGNIQSLHVENKRYAGDENGIGIENQICSYMKRKLPADAFNKYLSKTKEIQSADTSKDINDRIEEDGKKAKKEKSLLELMECIDGIKVKNGKVHSVKSFVKKFSVKDKKATTLGIHRSEVYNAIKDQVLTLKTLVKKKNAREIWDEVMKKTKEAKEKAKGIKDDFYSVLSSNYEILEQGKMILEDDSLEEKDKMKNLTKAMERYQLDKLAFDYSGLTESGGADDPRDSIGGLLDDGILNIVAANPKKISQKGIENPDEFDKLFHEKNSLENDYLVDKKTDSSQPKTEDYQSKLEDVTGEEKADLQGAIPTVAKTAINSFFVNEYIKNYFASYSNQKGGKQALRYQQEYLLCGEKTDKENLSETAYRLLAVRTVLNSSILFLSKEKMSEAYSVALAIIGFTGMEALVRLVQGLIIVTWGMLEGMVDVTALFAGYKVPVVKGEKELKIGMTDLLRAGRDLVQEKAKQYKTTKAGMDYDDYLSMFLMAMKDDLKRYRMMDLIQWDMQKELGTDFYLSKCVDQIEVESAVLFSGYFFRMPSIKKILKRDIATFTAETKQTYAYIDS